MASRKGEVARGPAATVQPFPARRATSRDVAAAAGVSQATVSNVINHPEKVTAATRDAVLISMAELHFVVHGPARLLRAGQATAIGLCVPDVSNPFWGEVTRGASAAAAQHGSALLVCSSEESPAQEVDLLRVLERQRVAGVLIAPVEPDLEPLDRLTQRGTPVVLLNRHDPRHRLPSAAVDDTAGGMLVGEHLLSLGHRRIAVVNGAQSISWCADRWDGIRQSVQEAGLDPQKVLHEVPVETQRASEGDRVAAAVRAITPRVTAVFCVNDLLALGLLRGLTQLNVRVPEDVSLVGYDDDDFTEMLLPSLTTVRQEPYRLGHFACARLLLEAESGERLVATAAGVRAPFQTRLIVRESVRRRTERQSAARVAAAVP